MTLTRKELVLFLLVPQKCIRRQLVPLTRPPLDDPFSQYVASSPWFRRQLDPRDWPLLSCRP